MAATPPTVTELNIMVIRLPSQQLEYISRSGWERRWELQQQRDDVAKQAPPRQRHASTQYTDFNKQMHPTRGQEEEAGRAGGWRRTVKVACGGGRRHLRLQLAQGFSNKARSVMVLGGVQWVRGGGGGGRHHAGRFRILRVPSPSSSLMSVVRLLLGAGLAAGGTMGYVKAGSKPSLFAGVGA